MTLPSFRQRAWKASKSNQVLSWAADLGGFSPSLVYSHSSGLVHLGFWLDIFFFLSLENSAFCKSKLSSCPLQIQNMANVWKWRPVECLFQAPSPSDGTLSPMLCKTTQCFTPLLLSLSSLWCHSRTWHMSHALSYEHVLYIFQYFSQFYTTTNSSTYFSFGLSSICLG